MELHSFSAMKPQSSKKSADEALPEERAPPALGEDRQFDQKFAGVQELAESTGNPRN
jgi:hypothetical protein